MDELIEAMGWKDEELVTINKNGEKRSLREALLHNYEITVLTKISAGASCKAYLRAMGCRSCWLQDASKIFKSYINGRDLLDLVQDYSLKGVPAGELVAILRKMPARLYSICKQFQGFPG